jgi:ribonuclease D
MPPENLVQPDLVRRLAWSPPEPPTSEAVAATLRAGGARAWQVGLVTAPLAGALPEPQPEALGAVRGAVPVEVPPGEQAERAAP